MKNLNPLSQIHMRRIACVKYSNGQVIVTSINGTVESVKNYFQVGKPFNVGQIVDGEVKDNIQHVVSCTVK